MDKDLKKKIEELRKAGFEVKRVVPTTKKTFEVPEDLLNQFMSIVKTKDLKVKDAVAEALEDWVKKRRG